MIPSNDIIEWSDTAPWISSEQVEQDLVICRSLVEIFADAYLSEHLAFRGGTALHKLYLTSYLKFLKNSLTRLAITFVVATFASCISNAAL